MELLLLLVFCPLIAGVFNGIFCRTITHSQASIISCTSIITATLSAIIVFIHIVIYNQPIHFVLLKWISIGDVDVHWSIYADQLTVIMFLLITLVSAIVHVYTLGYMATEDQLPKFLAYLSLFTFFMLTLVAADNFLQLFVGWEGVGVCSYLLIGYYYHKASATKAAIKAFIINRVGDFLLIIGIVMIAVYTNSLDFQQVFTFSTILAKMSISIFGINFVVLDIICFTLFLGCMGKSAQIGMHTWLPDAMEAPTPVSALIHAATMVTAGIFLLARCSFLFEYSPHILSFITITGAITCLFAATLAIVQTDIKKTIAYSTCSQLGYMFIACGTSAYQVSMFHLVTHGFFKALLFLSAGNVIHACHEQDLFKIGGLRHKMPITYAYFWIGTLAITGIYPFAGFYSKDLILDIAYAQGSSIGFLTYILGLITAGLTAFYSVKIIILVFHGRTHLDQNAYDHIYESPNIMNIPLVILTIGSMFTGMIGYYILQIHDIYGYFASSIYHLNNSTNTHHVDFIIQIAPLLASLVGMLCSFYVYQHHLLSKITMQTCFLYKILQNHFFDLIYYKIFVYPTKIISNLLNHFDQKIIDRLGPQSVVSIMRFLSWCICYIQTGFIFNYTFYIICALVGYITFLLANHIPAVMSL